ncbi:MAG: hypothetical protein C4325_00760 [Blastocatellia bacterium]
MKIFNPILAAALSVIFFGLALGQQAALKRTIAKTDKFDFGSGGTILIGGYPSGSIAVEGTQKDEIELEAEITIEAATESDLDRLSRVVGFSLDETSGRVEIVSLGPQNRRYLQKIDPKFPKALVASYVRIDYKLKVPRYSDLQIDGGKGTLSVKGVDGNIRINYLDADGTIELTGGSLNALFGSGQVTISIPTRSWRGRLADVQIARGNLDIYLPAGLNADLDATVLKSGSIENNFPGLVPRVRKAEFSPQAISAKSGTGGIPLKFMVGEGRLRICTYGARKK